MNDKEEALPSGEAIVLLREVEEERLEADGELNAVLKLLGLGG